MNQHIIVGNTLASLIAAYELGRHGKKVTLIKHKGGWGGHFSGLQINGEHFDAGMTIVELTSTNLQAKPDLASYDSLIRNDVGRFFSLVKSYVSEHFELREIEQPQSYFRGGWSDDFLLCNSFALFDRFSAEEKALIVEQLENRDSGDWQHASQKIILQDAHTAASYKQTSLFNHGKFVHEELIDPFVKKLTGSGAENISSIFHRRLWAPLYYPETIAQAAKGGLSHFGDTVVHYPSRSSFQSFARGFVERLNALETVTLIDAEVEQLDTKSNMLTVKGSEPLKYQTLAWGGGLPECQRLLGLQPIEDTQTARANLGFDFLQLDSKKILKPFSIAFVFDETIPFYRVTNQSYCASLDNQHSKLIVEYNTDYLLSKGIEGKEALSKATVNGLITMGIIKDASAIITSDVKIIPRLLPLPTMQYYECARRNIEMVQSRCPEVALMGDSTSIASRSFADHIVQGLQYAHCHGG